MISGQKWDAMLFETYQQFFFKLRFQIIYDPFFQKSTVKLVIRIRLQNTSSKAMYFLIQYHE